MFFIEEEPDVAIVLVQARGNLAATEVRDLVGEVEREVLRIPGIDNVVMTATAAAAASGGGGFGAQDVPGDQIGQLQIELADFADRRLAAELIFADIRAAVAGIPGMKVEIRKVEGRPADGQGSAPVRGQVALLRRGLRRRSRACATTSTRWTG